VMSVNHFLFGLSACRNAGLGTGNKK